MASKKLFKVGKLYPADDVVKMISSCNLCDAWQGTLFWMEAWSKRHLVILVGVYPVKSGSWQIIDMTSGNRWFSAGACGYDVVCAGHMDAIMRDTKTQGNPLERLKEWLRKEEQLENKT